MSEIQLFKEGDPILRQIAEPWDFQKDGSPESLIREMTAIMFQSNGIGLAAPQVGVSKRLFIMGNSNKLFACINPEIMSGEGEEKEIEGCLSFPNLWLSVKRFETIKVRYQVITGDWVEEQMSGLLARVFQHERDHLDGVCFDTRVAKLSLELAKERRRKRSR